MNPESGPELRGKEEERTEWEELKSMVAEASRLVPALARICRVYWISFTNSFLHP